MKEHKSGIHRGRSLRLGLLGATMLFGSLGLQLLIGRHGLLAHDIRGWRGLIGFVDISGIFLPVIGLGLIVAAVTVSVGLRAKRRPTVDPARPEPAAPVAVESGSPYRVAAPLPPDLPFAALQKKLIRSARLRALPLAGLAAAFVAAGAALIWTPPWVVVQHAFILAFVGDVLVALGTVLLAGSVAIALAAGRGARA